MAYPNVLFIISDQHNAKVLGCKGHPDVQTPNLDRLAASGVRFENAITQNPICTPSRVSYLSGQYCHNHGYYGLSGPRPANLPTLFGHLRRHGYASAAIGKIHCPEYWVEDDCDVFHETCECSIGGRSTAYADFLRDRGKLELEDHGRMAEFGKRGQQSMEGRPSPLTYEESQEGWIAATAIEFMQDSVREGKPFVVQTSLPRPHQCTAPSEPFWSMYDGKDLTMPPNADHDLAGKAPHMRNSAIRWRKGEWTLIEPHSFEAGRKRKMQGYLGAISQVDHAVGQMVDWLEANGLAETTIVIYTADHGDYACEHGIMEKAPGICSDAITRIPHIWRWPGHICEGHVADELVEAIDLPTTVCALAGAPAMATSDGKDISHLLRGESGNVRTVAVTEFAWSRSVRKGKYRLVSYPKGMFEDEYPQGFGELYDLETDPWEMTNLYFSPDHQGVVAEMTKDLLDWLVTTTRPVTTLGLKDQPKDAQHTTRYKCTVAQDGKLNPERLHSINGKNYL